MGPASNIAPPPRANSIRRSVAQTPQRHTDGRPPVLTPGCRSQNRQSQRGRTVVTGVCSPIMTRQARDLCVSTGVALTARGQLGRRHHDRRDRPPGAQHARAAALHRNRLQQLRDGRAPADGAPVREHGYMRASEAQGTRHRAQGRGARTCRGRCALKRAQQGAFLLAPAVQETVGDAATAACSAW